MTTDPNDRRYADRSARQGDQDGPPSPVTGDAAWYQDFFKGIVLDLVMVLTAERGA